MWIDLPTPDDDPTNDFGCDTDLPPSSAADEYVYAIATGPAGTVYAGTSGGLQVCVPPLPTATCGFACTQHDVFAAATDFISTSCASSRDVDVQDDDRLWVGSSTSGAVVLNEDDLTVDTVFSTAVVPDSGDAMPSNFVYSVVVDERVGRAYLATAAGLVMVDRQPRGNTLVYHLTVLTADLPSSTVTALALDPANNVLWAGGPLGVVRFAIAPDPVGDP